MKEIKRQFGLHFDFHANREDEIGKGTNMEDIEKYLVDAAPDFIQCDCKGHPGISSYPTKVGTPGPNMVKDNLRIWVEAAEKHNLPLFVHYSGVLDVDYSTNHPEEAALDANGAPYSDGAVSVFGNYAEKRLIPQMKELIEEYGIAGVWVDGDIWAVRLDYSDRAKPFLHEGITVDEHKRIMREGFLRYVRNYTDQLHAFAPDFKVTSNWLYSSYAPEKPEIDVDYLSGDFSPLNSAHFVRLDARVLAVQGKRWDLMAWSISHPQIMDKGAAQLQQEAAMVLSQGGGFQVYIPQNRDGSAKRYEGNRWKELGEFVRARKMLYECRPVAQIGVLFSADSFYKKSNVFHVNGAIDPITGTLDLLLEAGYTANAILEWHLDDIAQYEVVVIPEWEWISPENKDKLIRYARKGGKLVVIGAACTHQFVQLAGGAASEVQQLGCGHIQDPSGCFATVGATPYVDLPGGRNGLYSAPDLRYKVASAYRTDTLGDGTITYIPFDIGTYYYGNKSYIHRNLVDEVLSTVIDKFVQVSEKQIDVTMQQAGNGIYLNLINMRQSRHTLSYQIFDEVPGISGVEIVVNKKYSRVSSPLGKAIEWTTEGDQTKIRMDVDIHEVLLLEE